MMRDGLKRLTNQLLHYRYLLAILFLGLGVTLNLNGSSLNNWNQFGVSETTSGEQIVTHSDYETEGPLLDDVSNSVSHWLQFPPNSDGTIIGVPRLIRSDEWLVQTPFYLSQANTGNHLLNQSYAYSGQNMIVAYNAPVKHISIIGKPFNWGFLFLGAARGLSWYWCFKLLALLLLSYEFSLILTKGKKSLSLLGSLWVTFTPAIQWWFMQHLGDVVFFSLLMMVSIYHFFKSSRLWQKMLLAGLLAMGMIGFTLVIYPAFQVVFAYLILGFFIFYFSQALREKRLTVFDWLIMGVTALISFGIIGWSLWDSREALSLTLNTVYPGSRVSTGGEMQVRQFVELLFNVVLPYQIPPFSNQVELASAIFFVPFFAFSLPFVVKREDVKREALGIFLTSFTLVLLAYSIIGIPRILAKLTLFSYVTSSRSWQAASVIGVFASLWFIGYLFDLKKPNWKAIYINSLGVSLALLSLIITDSLYRNYISRSVLLGILVVTILLFLGLLWKKKLAMIGFVILVACSGMTVNPLVHGIDVIEQKAISKEINTLVKQDKTAIWLTDNSSLYQYPQMLGARAIDGVRFYPDKKLMLKLDVKKQFEQEWNRYAHIHYLLTDGDLSMTNPQPDNLNIQLPVDQLASLRVRYILTNRDLSTLFGPSFTKVYGADQDGNMIFKYQNEKE